MKGFNVSMLHFLQVSIILFFFVFSSFSTAGSSLFQGFKDQDKHSTCVNGEILYVGGSGLGNYSSVHDAYRNCSDGDTIFIYNGVYVWPPGTGITVRKNNVTFCGEEMNETIMDGQEQLEHCYFIVYSDNVAFRNIRFRNPEKDVIGGGPKPIWSEGHDTVIEHCYFETAPGGPAVFNTLIFRNNIVEEMLSAGVNFINTDPSPDDTYIIENNIFHCSFYANNNNQCPSVSNVFIVNNTFSGIGFGASHITNLVIRNNTFDNVENVEIGWDSSSWDLQTYNVVIEGNHFKQNYHWDVRPTPGMELWRSHNVTIQNNLFEGCGESIFIYNCTNVTVRRNDIVDGGKYGITFLFKIEDITITENNFDCNFLPFTFWLNEYEKDLFTIDNNYYAHRILDSKILWGWRYAPLSPIGRMIIFHPDRNPADEPFEI